MSKSKMSLEAAHDFSEVNRVFARMKTVTAQIKTSPTDGSGRFVAHVSTFHREPDVMGDVVDPHAFDRTIIEARAKHPQNLWPVWWQHGYDSPENSIGVITDAYVTEEGLVVEGRLAVDSNAKALEVYRGMLEDRIREWSIAYGVIQERREKIDGQSVNLLVELELLEISAVMAGANRYTRTVEVKAAKRNACACSSLERCARHRPRTKRAGTCPTCGKTQTWNVQHPVGGATIPWAACACGALVGWSGKMSTEDHIRQMKLIRVHLDSAPKVDDEVAMFKAQLDAISDHRLQERIGMHDEDLIARLDALDPLGRKHLPAVSEAATRALLAAADVADEIRTQITYPSHDRMLLRAAIEFRQIAERLARTEGPPSERQRAASNGCQVANTIRLTADFLRAGDQADLADRLDRAADRVTETCEPLAAHRLPPPAAVELSGPKAVPAYDLRFREIDWESVPDVVGETVTLDVAGTVEEQQTTVQGEGDTWRVPADLHERNLIDGEQIRIEQ